MRGVALLWSACTHVQGLHGVVLPGAALCVRPCVHQLTVRTQPPSVWGLFSGLL
jgi:hypothetical protein